MIGFVLTFDEQRDHAIYVTGDTVWYEGVAEVAKRFDVSIVLAFTGAAQTRGPVSLTMTADDANRDRQSVSARDDRARPSPGVGAFHPEPG